MQGPLPYAPTFMAHLQPGATLQVGQNVRHRRGLIHNCMQQRRRLFPVLDWAPNYQRAWLRGDLIAGFTSGIMLIPQGMAYAMIAGLPAVYGLYTALVPPIAYSIFGTSRRISIGPVAMDSLLVASALGTLSLVKAGSSNGAELGVSQYVTAAIFMALLVGIIQVVMGALRMGFVSNFLSRPVLSGFTSAAAIIIALSQLKHVLGISFAGSAKGQELVWRTLQALPQANLYAVGIGGATLAIIMVLKRYARGIPSALVVVALGTAIAAMMGWDSEGLPIVGAVPAGLPGFGVPGLHTGLLRPLLPLALTLALVGYAETIAIAKGSQERHPDHEVDANQEFIALGMSNVLGSLWSGYVATAGFSRSAVNEEAGAQTPFAGVVAAAVIALTLILLTPLFYYLPEAVLGAIIFAAVGKLIDVRYPIKLWRANRIEAVILVLTFLVTLTVGLVEGILAGMFVSLAHTVYQISTPHIAEIGQVRGTDYFRNVMRFPDDVVVRPDVLMFRFDAPIFFGNAGYFEEQLWSRVARRGPELKTVVLNSEAITYIDSTGQYMLIALIEKLQARGLRVVFSGAMGPVREVILRGRIGRLVGEEHMFVRSSEVLDYLDAAKVPGPLQRKIALEGRR